MSKFTLRWGILATGNIAQSFAKDLLIDPETRNVKDIQHVVVAAASSSGIERTKAFLKDIEAPSTAKAYGTYGELVNDCDVDIVYITTPHSHHYQNAMLSLEAGKHVLCEKAFTTNSRQAEILIQTARSKGLFLMEAVWTRYFPLSIYVRDIITSGRIGTVHRAIADTSLAFGAGGPLKFGDSHRMVNPDLAGGALLDLCIYSLTWIFQTIYQTLPEAERKPPTVMSIAKKYATGVDEMSSILMSFSRSTKLGGDVHAVATAGMRSSNNIDGKGTSGATIRIYGDKGEIQVLPPAWRPTVTRLIMADGTVEEKDWPQPGPGKGSGWRSGYAGELDPEGEGHGLFWEADECAFAIRDGRKEGKLEGLDESLLIMKVMDQVRQQNGLTFPDKVETTDYPVEL